MIKSSFKHSIKFHDFALLVHNAKGFGVLSNSVLSIGQGNLIPKYYIFFTRQCADDELVTQHDVEEVTKALENPKTQVACTLFAFSLQIAKNVENSSVQNFLRSFKFRTTVTVVELSVEGDKYV
jgi:hypothetical protein